MVIILHIMFKHKIEMLFFYHNLWIAIWWPKIAKHIYYISI